MSVVFSVSGLPLDIVLKSQIKKASYRCSVYFTDAKDAGSLCIHALQVEAFLGISAAILHLHAKIYSFEHFFLLIWVRSG